MVEFDETEDVETGQFIKIRDHLGHWVVLIAESIIDRPSKFEAGKIETLATCKFADLTDGDTALRTVSFSNPHIVKRLIVGGPPKVRKVVEADSSRPGFAKALVLGNLTEEVKNSAEYQLMKERAEALLTGPVAKAPAQQGVQLGLFD